MLQRQGTHIERGTLAEASDDAKQGCLIIVNLVAAFALGMAPWPKASTHREEIKRTDWILRT